MKFFGRKKRQLVRLLVVEDEPLVAFDTEHVLTDADYEVVATVDRVSKAVTLIDGGAAIDLVWPMCGWQTAAAWMSPVRLMPATSLSSS